MNFKFYLLPICFILAFECNLFTQSVDRGPYLQMGTTSSMVIKWRTDLPTSSQVWYGNSPGNLSMVESSASSVTDHEIEISGLLANTIYYYAVGDLNGQMTIPDDDYFFKTSPLSNTTQAIRTWVLGDPGTKDDNQRSVRDAYYDYIADDHTDLMLFLGDNAYDDGTQEEFQLALFENMYEEKLQQTASYSCYGNHEAHSSNTETQTGPYYDIFTFPTNAEAGGVASGTEAYYSFDYGNIHFVSLNSEDSDREPGGPMLTWLENDLNAIDHDWIVVIFHHPAYTGSNGNASDTNSKDRDMRENVLPILEDAGVDLVMFGHSHSYQRSFLVKDHYDTSDTFDPDSMGVNMGDGRIDGDSPYYKAIGGPNDGEGTVYIVAGNAGQVSSSDLNHPVMYHSVNKLGSVAIEVNDLQMDVNFIDNNGAIEDYFTIIKQDEPPTVEITHPLDGDYYETPETITIAADAFDSNGSITQVEFFIDNVSIGTDFSSPYNIDWTAPANGPFRIKAIATDNDGNVNATAITILVGELSICSRISGGNNDAEEKADGSVSTGSSDIELVFDGSNQLVGLRFTGLNIPQGASILNAHLQFTVDETTNSNPCNLNIMGELDAAPASFSTNIFNLSLREKTIANVGWFPPNWLSVGDSGPAQESVDISQILQEIVDQPLFTANSAVVIFIDGTGERVAESYNGDPSSAPQICIDYLPFCTDDDGDGVCNANDICPGGPEPGTICNDGDAGTYNDTINYNCICTGIPYDCPLAMANIGDLCNDGNAGTYNDSIDQNCNCTGIPYDCPLIMANIGDACDDGDENTFFDMIDEFCECTGSPLGAGTTVSSRISTGSDDAEERAHGGVKVSSSDLELVFDGSNQKVGMRFNDLNIPQGAIILDAYIQFGVDETANGNPCVLDIYGQDSDDTQSFSNSNGDISQRPLTTASVTWSPPDWLNQGEVGPAQQTDDISSIIQEIVDRPGYSATSSIVIIVQGTGERVAESYEGNPNKAPELFVTYEYDCIDSDGDGVCDQDDQCPGGPEPGTLCDDGDPNTSNDMIDANCNCTGIPGGTTVSVCSRVSNSNDDAEERQSGTVKLTSSDLEFIQDNNFEQTVGMRFLGLDIPQGVIINSASIQFTADESNNINPCVLNIYGEDNDNPLEYSSSSYNITNRPKTSASVVWTPSDWTKGDTGPAQLTGDLSAIIQEIVNRPGYTSNSAIAIIIDGVGKRVAESYNGSPTMAPELCVDYETPSQQNLVVDAVEDLEVDDFADETQEMPHNNYLAIPHLKITPNPANDYVIITMKSQWEGQVSCQIIDLSGKEVYTKDAQVLIGDNDIRLNNLNLNSGIYFVTLQLGEQVLTEKFVILK